MPPRITTPDKICKTCGKTFNRGTLRGGRLEDLQDFRTRIFCSPICNWAWQQRGTAAALAKLTLLEWAYLAGIFDGEGSVYLRRAHNRHGTVATYALSVTVVCGCHYESIKIITAKVGGKTLEKINDVGNKRPAWRVRLHGQQAMRFLQGVEPYLLMKQQQAKLAIEFQQAKPGRGRQRNNHDQIVYEQAVKDQMTILNQRGVQRVTESCHS